MRVTFLTELALSLSTVQTCTAGGGTLSAKATGDVVGAGLTDLVLSPDGTSFFSAAGSRDRVEAFASADLVHLATGALTTDAKDILIYEDGGITPVETVALDSGESVARAASPGPTTRTASSWSPSTTTSPNPPWKSSTTPSTRNTGADLDATRVGTSRC
ncbi:hypothetical protein L3Q67_35790 [Saccharothrix sp. AJ9571]|nr:hypothetical protein L3Q67_35790 [Saccharothrix sp. AJ9571]